MQLLRGEADINVSVRKACTPEETAPKRKHVRACAVYTWDHRNGRDFWHAIKLLPIQNDEIQLFKALITIHKVMQEGHKSVIKEAQNHTGWLQSLGNSAGSYNQAGYSRLIGEYVRLLQHKLEFHRRHREFSGTFEYEEYVSLRAVDDPNEGYESIIDLMNLQDVIDDFQRLVFSSLRGRFGNECRISSLIPMVAESYGIYRFITSMLRAMHSQNVEALEPLRERFQSQHARLRNFYFDASLLKYLTSLITVPELPQAPPNLLAEEDDAPQLPKRPLDLNKTGVSTADSSVPPSIVAQPTGDWWAQQQRFEDEQQRLQQEQQAELARQHQEALEQQRQFELQQQQLLAQQQAAQEEFNRQQAQAHAQGRVAELEQQVFQNNNQLEEARMMLQQYDQRVQALERELEQAQNLSQQQIAQRGEHLESLQTQVQDWKTKYEKLARLYSQLRQEHLDVLAKLKKAQTKAASALEAIEKSEKAERDLKARNLEMADLLRERDRLRYEMDKLRGQHKDETDTLERNVSLLNDKLAGYDRSNGNDVAALEARHAEELRLLEDKLASGGASQELLDNKDYEIAVLNQTVNELGEAVQELSLGFKYENIIDMLLTTGLENIQEALFKFENPSQVGTQSTTPPHILSIVETSSISVEDFSNAFNAYIAEGPSAGGAESASSPVGTILKTTMALATSIIDLLTNVKSLGAMSLDEDAFEDIAAPTSDAAVAVCSLYGSMQSDLLADLKLDDKIELVISGHVEVQEALQRVTQATEKLLPRTDLARKGDVGELVDNEMAKVAAAVEQANSHLTKLLSRPRDPKFSTFDRQINEAILSAAVAVTSAIAALVRAAADTQQEIVNRGRGSESRTAYYKKNHRWTQGLISAARAVAGSTNVIIETADGTLSGKSSPEELIVASKEVASSTAQLVAASRVRADHQSKNQDRLEDASKAVTAACRSLVSRVQDILASRNTAKEAEVDFSKLSPHEFKTASMEQQVEVLKLEQSLANARKKLFEIRKLEYVQQEDDEN